MSYVPRWRRGRVRVALAAAVAVLVGCAVVIPASADERDPEPGSPGPALGIPGVIDNITDIGSLPELPERLLDNPAGPPNGPVRDYGTPTEAPGKVCPFTDNVDVSLPVVNSPAGTPLPGLGGLTLDQPSVPASMRAELCMSEESLASARRGNPPTVLLLVHGITYGTWYWDPPYRPERYSAVNYLIKRGYATLNVDRIGEGRSSHPISPLVNVDTNAESVHQVVGKLRTGELGNIPFERVVTVGHSYGSATTWLEAAKHNDVDAVISTGFSSRLKFVDGAQLLTSMEPAAANPLTADQPWAVDPGYLQTKPGTRLRSPLFNPAEVEPGVAEMDERLANSVTLEEIFTFFSRGYDGSYKNIDVPLFLINGEYDRLFCSADTASCATAADSDDDPQTLEEEARALLDYEVSGFSSGACFRAASIPNMGHNTGLHRSAPQTLAQIAYFADQAVGNRGQNVDAYRDWCGSGSGDMLDRLPSLRLPPISGLGDLTG